jgi:hypothetical protein
MLLLSTSKYRRTIIMQTIYYGLVELQDKKTSKITHEITKISDSAILAACFLDNIINDNTITDKYEIKEHIIESDFIDKEYLEVFKLESSNSILINKLIPYILEYIKPIADDELHDILVEDGEDESFIQELLEVPTSDEPLPIFEFWDFIENYQHLPKSVIEDIIDEQIEKKSEVKFIKYCTEEDNIDIINSFSNSKEYLKYEYEVNEEIDINSHEELKYEDFDDSDFFEEANDSEVDPDTMVSINKGFIKLIVKEEWKEQLYFIKELYKRDDVFISIVSSQRESFGTFGQDNKEHIFSFIKDEMKEAQFHNSLKNEDFGFILTIRQFTKVMHKPEVPMKRVAMCFMNNDGIYPISKKETMDASLTCVKTGSKLNKEKDVQYIRFQKMLGHLDI